MIRNIVGIKRVDERRMDETKVEVGVKESFKKKWEMTKLATRADAQKVEGKRRRGRLKLRWGLH